MEQKGVIIVLLLLATLFLGTVGNFYTGNAVLNPSDLSLKNYPYPFIKNNVPNSLYIVIPYDYSYAEFDAARQISASLQGLNPLPPQIVTLKELPEGEHNLILIGNPCTNPLIADELATTDCHSGLEYGYGLLKLSNNERNSVLVVAGYSNDDLKKAVNVISNPNYYPLNKNAVLVSGNIGYLTLDYY